jgi:nicotinate-nucleotide pyrophosphorylase (carboxylating)
MTEGDVIRCGDVIAKVRGDIREILKRERTALNYLQVLSGIATATYKLANEYPERVASLRKTHPGLSYSEKRAVKIGGGYTHRLGLYDGFLIKDNHLAMIVKEIFGEGPITETKKVEAIRQALKRAKQYRVENQLENIFIEVEVESLEQAVVAAKFYREEGVPDMILLDNMEAQDVELCVKEIRRETGSGVLIESSGGVTAKNIDAYLKAGVDLISTSKITLSANPLDMSMKIQGYK